MDWATIAVSVLTSGAIAGLLGLWLQRRQQTHQEAMDK